MNTRIEFLYKRKGLYKNHHLKMTGENIEESFSRFSFPYFFKDQGVKNITLDKKDKFFLSFFENSIIKTDFKKYPNIFFWFDKNGNYLAGYKSKINVFWLSYKEIWSKFESKYSLDYMGVRELTQYLVERHFKMEGVTTGASNGRTVIEVERYFKMEGITTDGLSLIRRITVERHFKMKDVTTEKNGK